MYRQRTIGLWVWLLGPYILIGGVVQDVARGQELPEATLNRLKAATVLVRATGARSQKSAPGFLLAHSDSLGAIITSREIARDELGKGLKFDCVFRPGTNEERIIKARLAGIDDSDDLVVFTVADATLPEPLDIDIAAEIRETEPVFVLGFPVEIGQAAHGQAPTHVVSSGTIMHVHRDENGNTAALQIEGGVNPGTAGGPVVTNTGALVGAAISKLRAKASGFAIPAQKLMALMEGQVDSVKATRRSRSSTDYSYECSVVVIDPFSKISEVAVLGVPVAKEEGEKLYIAKKFMGIGDGPIAAEMQEDRLSSPRDGLATGSVRWDRPDDVYEYQIQLRWTRRDGTIGYSGPARVRLVHKMFAEEVAPVAGLEGGDVLVEEAEIPLDSPITAAVLGGSGRYLIAQLQTPPRIMVVDLQLRESVLTVDVPANVLIVANHDVFALISMGDNSAERWSLAGLKKSGRAAIQVPGQIRAAAMGHASRGPMLVHSSEGLAPRGRGYLSLVDPARMRAVVISGPPRRSVEGQPRDRMANEQLALLAAANGSVFGVRCLTLIPSGVELIFPDHQPLAMYSHTSLGYLAPTADGTGLCTENGFFSIDLVKTQGKDRCLPATTPDYYLSFAEDELQIRRVADGQTVRTLARSENLVEQKKKKKEEQSGLLPIEQRFFLVPQLNLLAMVTPAGDRLILAPVPLGGSGFSKKPDVSRPDTKRPRATDRAASDKSRGTNE